MHTPPAEKATYGFTILGVGFKLLGTIVLDNRDEIAAWASLAAFLASVVAIACGLKVLLKRDKPKGPTDA